MTQWTTAQFPFGHHALMSVMYFTKESELVGDKQ